MAVDYYTDASQDAIGAEEFALYEAMMGYRLAHGLPVIPLSASLSLVAARHALDTVYNVGSYAGHSWSDAPYDNANPATYPNMWQAPQRLGTPYPGNGYEITTGYTGTNVAALTITHEMALANWQGSAPHNDVILNIGTWSQIDWQAVGIGMYRGIAHVWFGAEADPAGPPAIEGLGPIVIAGTPEIDVYVSGWTRAETIITIEPAAIALSARGQEIRLIDFERVEFAEGILAFDLDGNAGAAYRIYQAAFDRTPDTPGLSYWVEAMDRGMGMVDVALRFLVSDEFVAAYGSNLTDTGFVDQLYLNILGRPGEPDGRGWWIDLLDSGGGDRAYVLASFAQSDENVALLAPQIQDGIWLL